jgi:hypothetical protein
MTCVFLAVIFTAIVLHGTRFGVVAIWWVAFAYSLPAIVFIVDEGVVLLRYFGLKAARLIVDTVPLMERAHRAIKLLVVWITVVAVPAVLLFRFPIAMAFLPFVPIHLLVGLAHALQPATVLVLAASSDAAVWLQERISTVVVPHRVVSMLLMSTSQRIETPNTTVDILRTIDDNHWREVVRELMKLVPIIVVDVRRQTEAVREELMLVRDLELEYKAVFVIAGDSAYPPSRAAMVHDWTIGNFVWYVTEYRRAWPTPELPLCELQLDFAEDVMLSGGHGGEAVVYFEEILRRFSALARRGPSPDRSVSRDRTQPPAGAKMTSSD